MDDDAGAAGPIRRAEPVMGTVVSFDVRPGRTPAREIYLALAEARDRLHRADAVFSTWKPNSPMSRLRRGEIRLPDAPPEMAEVLARCRTAKEMSGGWFDPWAMPGGVDPTGLVKGWAAEQALDALVQVGVEAAMVSAAGDIVVYGEPVPGRPWRIGIQAPWDRAGLIGVVDIRAAIATSGTYERGPHVLDPHTGQPASETLSATVLGPRLDLADALATALVAGGSAALSDIERVDGYEALMIRADGSRAATGGFTLTA